MLKLQHKGSNRSVWLVGPSMKVGSAKTCDLVVLGSGVANTHCQLFIDESNLLIVPIKDCDTFLNEIKVKEKTPLKLNDTVRIGQREFVVIDPKQTTATASASVSKLGSFSPTTPDASGWMIQGLNSNIQNKRFPIEGSMALGRSKECELHFAFDRLSRKHAQFKIIDGVLLVEDLNSSNGTFHNGKRVQRARLNSGDCVSFDKLEFTVLGKSDIKDNAETSRWDNSLNQTVVRSAITPEMIEKSTTDKDKRQKANDAAAKMTQASPSSDSNTSNIIIAILALFVAGLATAAVLM